MTSDSGLVVAIDTASDVAGVALCEAGGLLGEVTWQARQSHSRQLLPALDWLLGHVGRDKQQISAVCVCLGPGSYAGMRVGLSTAKALAFGFDASLAGVGRLAAEALPIAEATAGRVVSLQAAGRAELAWAAYRASGDELEELEPPQLIPIADLGRIIQAGDVITGDITRLDAATLEAPSLKRARLVSPAASRVASIARLGLRRLARNEIDNPDTLVPLYLRAPAIGPQT
ncbi:MAG TPA: tRNA (adenosine(37)-N6)-threonylcarbamoyltransferase complex dimerization subunit type 1 TsaB [Dehalococcoidia bacterium]|nr:tRNA (adenosine(37)-N6)-threonylcarbamoyltransferase complex dimerization subunit type 1 TsaB [Dehalococcoidia bacterium]